MHLDARRSKSCSIRVEVDCDATRGTRRIDELTKTRSEIQDRIVATNPAGEQVTVEHTPDGRLTRAVLFIETVPVEFLEIHG
jgi:hypothetical protein